jgi:hypothetical protein
LFFPEIIERKAFDEHVTFEYIDMNHIPPMDEKYDFIWSSCALEHLGSAHRGEDFIYRAMDCLKSGGVAIHTTELNLSSPLTTGNNFSNSVIFSAVDFIRIAMNLSNHGHKIEPLDFRLDGSALDYYYALPPYDRPHFKLLVGDCISTSFALIIEKNSKNSFLTNPG